MKVNVELQIDTETNTVILVGATNQEVPITSSKAAKPKSKSKSKTKSKSSSKANEADTYDFPCIVLEESRLVINDLAFAVLGADVDDRLHIKYNKKDGVVTPVIARNDVFGVKAGNKINKNKTVSWRGKNNDTLSEYGEVFRLEEYEEKGIYKMVDINAEPEKPNKGFKVTLDKNIKPINEEPEVDLEVPSKFAGDSNSFEIDSTEIDDLLDDMASGSDEDIDNLIDNLGDIW